MPLPAPNLYPPFNTIRLSHTYLNVADLDVSKDFYTRILGLQVTDETASHVYLRAMEERGHHCIVLQKSDHIGIPLEFYHKMDRLEPIHQQYELYEDEQSKKLWAAWMHRKGGVHDMAFTNGTGPRMHHVAFWVPTPLNIIDLLDLMATTGHVDKIERGPGRHGISNAFFLYVLDPDGHRIEIYCSDYQTVDPDLEPIKWDLTDPQRQTLWGAPAPKSWFEHGTAFVGAPPRAAELDASPIIAP